MSGKNKADILRLAVSDRRSARLAILGICLALLSVLIALKIFVLLPELSTGSFAERVGNLFAGIAEDIVLCCGVAAVAYAAHAWLPAARAAVAVWTTLAVGILFSLYGVANVEIVRLLGEPVTIDWLKYSDFLSGAINGILHSITWTALLIAIAGPVFFLMLSAAWVAVLFHLGKAAPRAAAGTAGMALLAALYLGLVATPSASSAKLSNPILAFGRSTLFEGGATLDLGKVEADFAAAAGRQKGAAAVEVFVPDRLGLSGIKNVVLFVMESVPAEYVYDYPSPDPITPNISKYAANALRFDNIYAHAPATNYSLFSLLTSIVPELSSTGMTEKYPDLPLPSIANVLSDRGYRTAYISSSDSRFQSTNLFLGNKGFDVIEDFRDWTCDRIYKNSSETWRYMDFSSDLCTVERLKSWIAEDISKPFFATFWTGMTHYPYFTEGEVKSYVKDADLNRFLNALSIGDAAFGRLMDFLEEMKLAKDTLVVVVGDHGEAFGQHGTFVHASAIYDENIRVPLLFINEGAFSGQRAGTVGGGTDVAPTILDVLNIERPVLWQGRSLFDAERSGRVYFFSPWNGFKVGYREGSDKFIYNSDGRRLESYDLASDPGEKHDLTKDGEAETEVVVRNLASWVKYQTGFIDDVVLKQSEGSEAKASVPSIKVSATGTSFRTPPRARVDVDGETLGVFDVIAAPKNAIRWPSDADIDKALSVFEFPLNADACPKRVDITFLNDEWDAENEIGDTNLFVEAVDVMGVRFYADDLKIGTPDAASRKFSYMVLWRQGSIHLDVDALRVCG